MQKEAIESFKQAIKINPDYAEAHYSLDVAYSKSGMNYIKSGMNKEAIEALP